MIGNFADRRVVLVTGGAKGIGRAIAREFAGSGAHVLINYFHSPDAAESTLDEVIRLGGSGELIRGSVAKPESVQSMFDTIAERHGRLDVLVNNAARGVFAPADTITDIEWSKVFDVNVHGARRCCWAALPLLAPRDGTIVNVSSIGAGMVMDNYITVGVSKAALEALTRYLAVEFASHGVRVNTASAGPLDNPTVALFPDAADLKDTCAASAPLGRLGTETELARLVIFLAAPHASWVTGQTLLADGGLGLGHAMLRAHEPTARPEPPRQPNPVTVTPRPEPSPRPTEPPSPDADTIAIVGMGIAAPGAYSPDEFWNLITSGKDVFGDPGDRFRHSAFRDDDRGAEDHAYTCRGGFLDGARLHPSTRRAGKDLAARALRHAVRQAYDSVVASRQRVGVWSGMSVDHNQSFEESMVVEAATRLIAEQWPADSRDPALVRRALLDRYPHAGSDPSAHLPMSVLRAATADILPGTTPYVAVDTACSSGLYAVDLAVKSLLAGEVDIALSCGVAVLSPRLFVEFCKLSGLSPSGHVRPFGADADGTLFADAAVAVTLKHLDKARRDGDDVLAVLGGFGAASDGRGKAVYAPNTTGQIRAMARARAVNGLAQGDIDWIIAHATGTPAGDSVEINALETSTPDGGLLCTSNKAIIGHTGWAAGLVSLIHAVLGLQHAIVPAQTPLGEPAPALSSGRVRVPREHTPLPSATSAPTLGVSAFGFGGTNAHQIVRDEPADGTPIRSAPPRTADPIVLVAWSAHLPGSPSRDDILRRVAEGGPPCDPATFPRPFPSLPREAARLTPHTVATIDPAHLMALAVTHQFAAENGALWRDRSETTGVLAAHTGPTGVLREVTLRCYADDLVSLDPDPRHGVDTGDFTKAVANAVAALKKRRIPTNEDTMPGHMPNVIPARVANHLDLHGPSITIDTGRTSTATAIHTASHYLATGELDMALVLAVNGSAVPGEPVARLTEGAFLFALARESDARRQGWPVLADIAVAGAPPNARRRTHGFLGADGAIDILESVATGRTTVVPGELSAITIDPRDRGADVARVTTRHVPYWEPRELPAHVSPTAPPAGCVVITDEATAAELRADTAAVLTVSDDTDPEAALDRLPGEYKHVRVIVPRVDASWPGPPPAPVLRLHEALFRTVQRGHRRIRDHGSIGVAVLDGQPGGVPAPHSGLFTGFVKSISWEFPDCSSHALISDADPRTVWRTLETDIAHARGLPITIYRDGLRCTSGLREAPDDSMPLPLRPGSTVVAVGGARGITGAVVEELAREVPLDIWLIGSSHLDEVPAELIDATDADLPRHRAAFIARGLQSADPPSVAELNRRFDRIMRAREASRTLNRLHRLRGEDHVHYLTADVTDAVAVQEAADTIASRHRSIDLLINGAGTHHPCDIERKTLDGFRAVRDVKVSGYHNLKRSFAARRWINFGSVTGVVGLPGETEYSSGNDYLSHATAYEKAVRGQDECTIAWTVWDEVGLGAGEIAQSMVERTGRLSSMPKEEGTRHFIDELGRRDDRPPVVTFIGDRERDSINARFPGFLHPDGRPRAGTCRHQGRGTRTGQRGRSRSADPSTPTSTSTPSTTSRRCPERSCAPSPPMRPDTSTRHSPSVPFKTWSSMPGFGFTTSRTRSPRPEPPVTANPRPWWSSPRR